MIPAGYMAKEVVAKPDWLETNQVEDIYSVSGCFSKMLYDIYTYGRHNDWFFVNSSEEAIAQNKQESEPLSCFTLFYYELYEREFDGVKWREIKSGDALETNVVAPLEKKLEGYDVFASSSGIPECSPLSCNSMAKEVSVNKHCLFNSFEEARRSIESGVFKDSEPGPYRICAVYTLA